MTWNKTCALLGAALVTFAAGPAPAENLDLGEMAAALALPIVTGSQQPNPLKITGVRRVNVPVVTLATVTNGKSDPVLLKVDMISGDPGPFNGSTWQSTSFDCLLTGRETTTFVFVPGHEGQLGNEVYVECSQAGNPEGAPTALFTNLQNGILFIAVADPETGEVVSEDAIFGDAVIADVQFGDAYSFGAIAFQAGAGLNDGDKVYAFDGDEYAHFPAVLATNFIAPTNVAGAVQAELILFTLDGTVGNLPVPRVKLGGFGYNDDEVAFDFSWEFDCFDIVPLEFVNPNFEFDPFNPVLGLGSMSGHLELVAQPIATPAPDTHDAQYGDANNSRKRGVHGWILQRSPDVLVHAGQPIAAQPMDIEFASSIAAWGRPLGQSTTALIPFLEDDDTTLDADVRN